MTLFDAPEAPPPETKPSTDARFVVDELLLWFVRVPLLVVLAYFVLR